VTLYIPLITTKQNLNNKINSLLFYDVASVLQKMNDFFYGH
jgi:hypothetical protein